MATSVCICMTAMVLVVTAYAQGQSNITHIHQHIVNDTATMYIQKLNIPASDFYKLQYHITFNEDKCCPEIIIYPCQDECLDDEWPQENYILGCWVPRNAFVPLYSPNYIVLEAGYSTSGCRVEGGYHTCDGKRTLAAPLPTQTYIHVGYRCKDSPKPLNLTIDWDVEYFPDYEFPCEPVKMDYCKKRFGFNSTAFPNVPGQLTQVPANKILALILNADKLWHILKCYQHMALFACLALFPPCHSGNKRLLPCTQMCRELVDGCAHELDIIGQQIHCEDGMFLDSIDPKLCFYQPVTCPQPQQPESGYISTNGLLLGNTTMCTCNEGYEIQGDVVRHCTIKGLWNSTDPICIATDGLNPHLILTIVLPAVMVILSIVITGICVYHRQAIYLLIFHNKRMMKSKNIDQATYHPKKTLFITYSSADSEEVNKNFIPEAQKELPEWNLITYEKDFIPGRSIIECIHEGVWNSTAVLVLLTENYIASSYCRVEFIEAQTRSVTDKNFRHIVVLFTKDNDKIPAELSTDFPKELREYVKTRIYLPRTEPLFWNKLRRSLLKQKN